MWDKKNPNNFQPGDAVVLDANLTRAVVIIHDITETGTLCTVGLPGALKEKWWIVQTKRLTPKHEHN